MSATTSFPKTVTGGTSVLLSLPFAVTSMSSSSSSSSS
eukprot:CAMPEP_0171085456 /NCGR_PEP_ID=MMETSP0766_2-20121228/18948_1 /TAXON_ID=439317 /ORGANISM="Gambierdiscus australes, Strain CAWD 149" /LENGTH=37 /DNA_ID= /DNA_START= /DNA_END= /DNA_ORIENTATION=